MESMINSSHETPLTHNNAMAESQITLKKARKKWASQSANKTLLPGERIKLIYAISVEAEQMRRKPNNVSEKEIKLAFCDIYTDPVKGKKISSLAAYRYFRLYGLAKDVIDKIAEHASGKTKPVLTMSHAVTLAEVRSVKEQRKLLTEAIRDDWNVRTLKMKTRQYRKLPSANVKVRHKVLIGKLDAAAKRLNELLTELTKSKHFLKTIDQSDRRSKPETAKLLKDFGSSLSSIGEKLEHAKGIADKAAEKLSKATKA